MPIVSRNPSTGEIIKQFESYSDECVDKLLLKSYSAHKKLKKISFNKRAVCMMAVARILNTESEKLGKILTQEMGKTHTSAIAEIKNSALGNFATQNRLVTREDYIARVYAMPPKYGSVSKAYLDKDFNIRDYFTSNSSGSFKFGIKSGTSLLVDSINGIVNIRSAGTSFISIYQKATRNLAFCFLVM